MSKTSVQIKSLFTISRLFRCALVGVIAIALAGCTSSPTSIPSPVVTPAAVPSNQIVIQFETLSCVCNLGDIEFALLALPGVGSVDWDLHVNQATLVFIDAQRPSDSQIRESIQHAQIKIEQILRPS